MYKNRCNLGKDFMPKSIKPERKDIWESLDKGDDSSGDSGD